MLNFLRDSLKKGIWPKVVLGVTAVGLVAYLGAYFSCESGPRGGGDWAALVGGEMISTRDFLQTARMIDQNYRELFGSNYEQFKQQARIGSQAVQTLIEREMIRQDAMQLGLSVSQDELVERIRTMDELKDPSGRFVGRERYVQVISRGYPGGIPAFEQALRGEMLQEKWLKLVAQPAEVSEAELEAAYRQRSERTATKYVVVRAADQRIDSTVSDEDAARWYGEHQDLYLREEGRMIRYLQLSRQQLMEGAVIGEEEISAFYQGNLENYSHGEQRSARHILIRTEPGATEQAREQLRAQAEEVLQRLRLGEDFATLAAALSQDPGSAQRGGDLGFFGRGDMVAPFEEAAFNTAVGELAPVVESQFGFHVVEVTDARPAGSIPIEDVTEDIRRTLELRRGQELVASEAQRLKAELQSAERFEEVASREGLAVESIFVNPETDLTALRPSPEFIGAVMELAPGVVSAPLRTAGGMVLIVVDEIIPTSVPPLEEIASTVRSDVLSERSRQAALDAGERALRRNSSFNGIARELGGEIQESGSLAPGQEIPGTGGSTSQLREALFGPNVDVGDRGIAAVPDGAVVYEVTERQSFDPGAFTAARGQLRAELLQQRRELLRRSLLTQLGERLEVAINEDLVQQYNN
jgi:peptidyl-prolyl cis-trans isomerase D